MQVPTSPRSAPAAFQAELSWDSAQDGYVTQAAAETWQKPVGSLVTVGWAIVSLVKEL